jgi:hypothetical protein
MVEIVKPNLPVDELAEKVFQLFSERGYKLEEGTKLSGIYANGSAAMRVLVGGFAKRNKFSVKIVQNAENTSMILLDKAMVGALGGAIGVSKLNKEFGLLQQMLSQL